MWLNHWKLRWTKIGNKDCPGKVGFDLCNLRMGARAQGLLAESKTFSFNVKRARLLLSILQAFHLLRRHNRESFFVCVYWSRALKNFEWLQALRSRLKVFALLSQSRLSFRKRCWLREGEGLKGRGGAGYRGPRRMSGKGVVRRRGRGGDGGSNHLWITITVYEGSKYLTYF